MFHGSKFPLSSTKCWLFNLDYNPSPSGHYSRDKVFLCCRYVCKTETTYTGVTNNN